MPLARNSGAKLQPFFDLANSSHAFLLYISYF